MKTFILASLLALLPTACRLSAGSRRLQSSVDQPVLAWPSTSVLPRPRTVSVGWHSTGSYIASGKLTRETDGHHSPPLVPAKLTYAVRPSLGRIPHRAPK